MRISTANPRHAQVTAALRGWNQEQPPTAVPAHVADASERFWTLSTALPTGGLPTIPEAQRQLVPKKYGLKVQMDVDWLYELPATMPVRTEGPAIRTWLSASIQLDREDAAPVESRCACVVVCDGCSVHG